MSYSESQINELALGQLSSEKLQKAVEAFNGFSRLFGETWLERVFQGGKSAYFALHIMWLWENWFSIKGLEKSDQILARWKSGFDAAGIQAEIHIVARLVGLGVQVELFPEVGSRFSDFRFKTGSDWVYGEISRRGISKVRKRGTQILGKIAKAAAEAMKGQHGKVAVLRDLEDKEVEQLVSWLNSLSECGEASLEDFAVYHTGEINSTMDQDKQLIELVREPKLCCTFLARPNEYTFLKGTACMCISDRSAQKMLETEATQLSKDHPGVVILDLSSMIGNHSEWRSLIERRLQPRLNTRISGVVLYQSRIGSEGIITDGEYIPNRYASNPLPLLAIPVMEKLIKT